MASQSSGPDGSAIVEETQDGQPSQSTQDDGLDHYQTLPENPPNYDEESPLLSNNDTSQKVVSVWSVITVLLLGEFISNADSTIIMSVAAPISSQFDRLQDANWLSTAYALGACATQALYGKLSDIFGRKPLLVISYVLLALGCIICGVAQSMTVVILGRMIGGVGGAGVTAMSAIIITDIVPKREIAAWRAIINISMTLGRSVGGPLGGWLSDTIGWRWLFIIHAPVLGVAVLCAIFFFKEVNQQDESQPGKDVSLIRRIDFLGTVLLASSIVAAVLLLDRGGKAFAWTSGYSIGLALIAIITFAVFVYVELYVVPEPILDLRIFRKPNVVPSYLIGGLQSSAQVGMMFTVPLYFQVMMDASSTIAGLHLVPAVLGNTVGGLLAGFFIRGTGRYKPVLIIAGILASISYVLLYFRWNGYTGIWESLYITPGGMGTAFAQAATFVALTSSLEPNEVAMATGGYILFCSFAFTAGITAVNTVLGVTFKSQMEHNLRGEPDMETIIHRAMSDTSYIASLPGRVKEIVLQSYLSGLHQTYVISFINSILGSLTAWTAKDRRL